MNKTFKFITLATVFLVAMSCTKPEQGFKPGDSHKPEIEKPDPILPPSLGEPDWAILTSANHPRIIYTDKDFQAIKTGNFENTPFGIMHSTILNEAEHLIGANDLEHKLSGKRMLDVSRNALKRISYCAYAYKTTGEKKFFDQAVHDMETVCKFPDWNARKHFLDVGEMSAAVALGYDWLYKELTSAQKSSFRKALHNYAFDTALNRVWNLDFYASDGNWNQVCNAGLVCGALAVFEDDAQTAKTIVTKAIESNARAMEAMYAPDGVYPEGYSYWNYGTGFETLMLTALQTAGGSDCGLSEIDGFEQTGKFMIHMEGPLNMCFNYSDCAPSVQSSPYQWYFAMRFKDLSYLYLEKDRVAGYGSSSESRLLPLVSYFAYKLDLKSFGVIPAPEEKIFNGKGKTPVVMIHENWKMNQEDKFLGIKGGKARTGHAHQDAGSFVYDALGVRWSADMGLQSYSTLEPYINLWDMSDGSERWSAFRYNNFNHSTLTVNDKHHLVDGFADFLDIIDKGGKKGAVIDITAPLKNEVASAIRTIYMEGDNLYVTDRVKAQSGKSAEVRWTMVSRARPTIEYGSITLKSASGKYMFLSTSSSTNHRPTLKIWSTKSNNSWDAPNTDYYECGYVLNIAAGKEAEITVKLSPEE